MTDWSTLEDLELDTDDDMIDVSDFFTRPSNDKRSPRPKQTTMTHLTTQGHCPTPQRHPKVQYKLKVYNNPTAKNMPQDEEYDDNNYKSIDETTV